MKTLLTAALAALLCAGCKMPPTSAQMTLVATHAAYTGATIDLLKNPKHCEAYKNVTIALDDLDNAKNYDPVAFTMILQQLPIKELDDPRARLIIGEAWLLWDIYAGQIVTTNQLQFVQPVLRGTDAGLKRAMATAGCK